MATEVSQLLDEGSARLQRVTEQPRREAEILLGTALGRSRAWLLAHADERILDCDATDRYEALITRRAHGEPVAYLLGTKEFWSLELEVTPDVLVPRPETELVVELALRRCAIDAEVTVLDLATGSGAIALAIAHERPAWRVLGTDVSAAALTVARRNAERLQLANVSFAAGSWYEPVDCHRFDLIVGNPPYIAVGDTRVAASVRRYEPHDALYAGNDGLDAVRAIVGGASAHLQPGGWLIMEHGNQQGDAVRAMLTAAGFSAVDTHRDLAGLDRCSEGHWGMPRGA